MAPKRMTNEEIKIVVALHKEGKSARSIAKIVGRGSRSVDLWLKRFKESPGGETPVQKKHLGKPRKTSRSTDKLLKRAVIKDPSISARQLKFEHPELLHDVSIRTIQHRLQKDLKMPLIPVAKKPLHAMVMQELQKSNPLSYVKEESILHCKKEIKTENEFLEDTELDVSCNQFKLEHVEVKEEVIHLEGICSEPSTMGVPDYIYDKNFSKNGSLLIDQKSEGEDTF